MIIFVVESNKRTSQMGFYSICTFIMKNFLIDGFDFDTSEPEIIFLLTGTEVGGDFVPKFVC